MKESTRTPARAVAEATELYGQRKYAEAEACCQEVLERHPDHAQALFIAGLAAMHTGRPALAVASLERVCELVPDSSHYHYNLAVTLNDVGRPAEALTHYQTCLRLQPSHWDAMWNGGELLRMREHFKTAAEYFEQLIPQAFRYRGLYHRLAVCYGFLGRTAEAEKMFKQELALGPYDESLTLWEYSHLLLAVQDFARGWVAYDRRFDSPKTSVTAHPFPFPRWAGSSLAGKTLLVHSEQGLGDEIMFASIIPDLRKRAAEEGGRLVLACSPALARIFGQAWPDLIVLPHIQGVQPAVLEPLGRVDFQIPFGSLARYFRNSKEAFGTPQPYLISDPQTVARYRQLLAELAPGAQPKLRVGLVWGTNPALHHQKAAARASQKSIPVRLLAPLGGVAGVQFVSLQNREVGATVADLPELNPIDLSSELLDFSETAGLIDALDLVITVDTSVAHLSGAMGQKTWVPLMKHCDWRWGRKEASSYWYPRVRLFRQTQQGDWPAVIEQLREALERAVADPSTL